MAKEKNIGATEIFMLVAMLMEKCKVTGNSLGNIKQETRFIQDNGSILSNMDMASLKNMVK